MNMKQELKYSCCRFTCNENSRSPRKSDWMPQQDHTNHAELHTNSIRRFHKILLWYWRRFTTRRRPRQSCCPSHMDCNLDYNFKNFTWIWSRSWNILFHFTHSNSVLRYHVRWWHWYFLFGRSDKSILELIDRAQSMAIVWCNSLWATGGALRPEKCWWYLVQFRWVDCKWK